MDNISKSDLTQLINSIKLATQTGSVTTTLVAKVLEGLLSGKQDIVEGKGLSANDYTDEEKQKLADIATNANKYEHPDTHPASMITPDATHCFLTEVQRQALTTAIDDWSGTQAEYDAMTTHPRRWYLIKEGSKVVALYLGDTLVCSVPKEPNLVGEFTADSLPEDWYWWPNGVKTALPVDPVTKRFEAYWPEVLESGDYLFSGGADDSEFVCRIKALYKMPLPKVVGGLYRKMPYCETVPVLDCGQIAPVFNVYYSVAYVMLKTPLVKELHFANTGNVTTFEMVINSDSEVSVDGIDFSLAEAIKGVPFGLKAPRISGINLGKRQDLASANLYSENWGNDAKARGARQSVIDTLITNSYDRAAAGWASVTLMLSTYTHSLLTDAERTAITAKGYTITVLDSPSYN